MNFRWLLAPILTVCFVLFSPLHSQTRDVVEKRIANLPADQRAYERYRYWITTQSPEIQRNAGVLQRYREYLKTQGFSKADIDAQIETVEQRGRELEVERWNRILTADKPMFNVNPNAFLVEMAKDRRPGTALDVGMGQGRNSIWLAQHGWTVSGFDPADKAVALANQTAAKLGLHLQTEIKGVEDFDFGQNRWDLVLISYAGGRGLSERIQGALRPGGILVIEGFHRDAAKARSIGSAVVFDTGEIPAMFPGLRTLRYEEPLAIGDFGRERVRLVRYCGEKPQ